MRLSRKVQNRIMLVLIFLLIGGGSLAIYLNVRSAYRQQQQEALMQSVWEQSYLQAIESFFWVDFVNITTTIQEFELLRCACEEASLDTSFIDAMIEVDTTIEEPLYVDAGSDNPVLELGHSEIDSTDSGETGPIYFQDLLMLRYINNMGELQVLFAQNTYAPEIYRQTDVHKLRGAIFTEDDKKDIPHKGMITETQYLTGLIKAFLSVLQQDINKNVLNYFSPEGLKSVLQTINTQKDYTIFSAPHTKKFDDLRVTYINMGMSDLKQSYKDRIYLQLEIPHTEGSQYLYVVLKINRNLQVFDVDIL